MHSVVPEGFEPPTNRTGICHSIQLNYGTFTFISANRQPVILSDNYRRGAEPFNSAKIINHHEPLKIKKGGEGVILLQAQIQ